MLKKLILFIIIFAIAFGCVIAILITNKPVVNLTDGGLDFSNGVKFEKPIKYLPSLDMGEM